MTKSIDLVTVQIKRGDWETIQRASAILVECGAQPDNDAGHLLREFCVFAESPEEVAEHFLDGAEGDGLDAVRERFNAWRAAQC